MQHFRISQRLVCISTSFLLAFLLFSRLSRNGSDVRKILGQSAWTILEVNISSRSSSSQNKFTPLSDSGDTSFAIPYASPAPVRASPVMPHYTCAGGARNKLPQLGTSNCPKPKWVDEMVQADSSANKNIIVIGCNKGNDAIRWMEMWDKFQDKFWNQVSWNKQLAARYGKLKYVCNDGIVDSLDGSSQTNNPKRKSTDGTPTCFCVEPMPLTFKMLNKTSMALGYVPSTPYGSFNLLNAAVAADASPDQKIPFPIKNIGSETSRIGGPGKKVMVQVTTADAIADRFQFHTVDVLSIDVEGWDAEVLKGAKRTLEKVRYLEFEVHRDLAPWSKTSLKSVVDDLSTQGFECYWAGNDGKLTNIRACWKLAYENAFFANAACVKRGDVWSAVLQRFAV